MNQGTISVYSEGKKSDLTVGITGRPQGRDFEFILKGNHLRAHAGKKGRGPDEMDWLQSLNENEKAQVMSMVLANYRAPSLNRDRWKVSAIGIVENPDPDAQPEKKHLMYVGVNTDLRSDSLDKDCAEQDMLGATVTNISHYQFHKRGVTLDKPPAPMEVHVMGGREPDPNDPQDKGEKMIAPCGKCTDTLAERMAPESFVYIYPKNNGRMPLKINDTAESLEDVKGNEVWKTTIGHLNRLRHIPLSTSQKKLQDEGVDALVGELLQPPQQVTEAVIERTTANKRADIESVAELDVATLDGILAPEAANAHLHSLIVRTLRSRMRREGIELKPETVRQWVLSDKIDSVSATIVQYDDGTYTHGLKAQTAYDGSSANSQLSGVNNTEAVIKTGDQHIIRVWSMNFSPADIAKNRTTTPSKDGVERIVKKMNGSAIEKPFTHFSFNSGALDKKQASDLASEYKFSRKDLYPGGFRGSSWQVRTAGNGVDTCGHCH